VTLKKNHDGIHDDNVCLCPKGLQLCGPVDYIMVRSEVSLELCIHYLRCNFYGLTICLDDSPVMQM